MCGVYTPDGDVCPNCLKAHDLYEPKVSYTEEQYMFHNVVIGKPLIEPWVLLAHDRQDWLETEEKDTLFTDTRFCRL